jgi:two-component system chemotaxis sensor kinase CheA
MEENSLLNDPEMKEIFESFIIETNEILEKLDLDLVDLEKTPKDSDLLNTIFRAFHTIKGTSGFLGLEKLQMVTHVCEDILNKLRKGEADLTSDLMDAILAGYDKIKELVGWIEEHKNEDVDVDDAIKILKIQLSVIENKKAIAAGNEDNDTAEVAIEETITEDFKVEVAVAVPKDVKTEAVTEVKLEGQKVPVKPEVKKKKAEKKVDKDSDDSSSSKKEDTSIRVDVERLEQLLNIVSELVLGRNQLLQVNSEIAELHEGTQLAKSIADASKQIDLMTNELQLVVMKTRMVKIGKVFNRFPRLVRDLSKEMSKQIRLVINGEETELDKTLIEEINDPLVHLVRNSIDHGIESPEDRKAIGKDPIGTITLSAIHEGNDIIISIEDDGKGMDPEFLKEKAVSKGLITEAKAKEMSVQEAYNLIFLPGFSTAAKVTNISGRGVGMDVVRTNVAKLRGVISVESAVGKGTKMVVKLPLTLAIISGMVVRAGREKYVIPLSSVIEVIREHVDNISTINGNQVVRVRELVLPLVDIDNLLDQKMARDENKVWQYIVLVGVAEKKFGIKVDELIGQKEIVIKTLGDYLGRIKGIAGSTIMGDGTVVMILDLSELINRNDYVAQR